MSKFSDFVAQKKLDLRRIRIASVSLEKLRPEDRAVRLAHKNRGEGKPSGNKGADRRSGRPITPRALDAANAGKSLTGPQKTRLLNAVNRVLEQKKLEVVTLEALFLGSPLHRRGPWLPACRGLAAVVRSKFGPLACVLAAWGPCCSSRPRRSSLSCSLMFPKSANVSRS